MNFTIETSTQYNVNLNLVTKPYELGKYLGVKNNLITEVTCTDINEDLVIEDKSFVDVKLMLEDNRGKLYELDYFTNLYLVSLNNNLFY